MLPVNALARSMIWSIAAMSFVDLAFAQSCAAGDGSRGLDRLPWDLFLAEVADKMEFQFTYEIATPTLADATRRFDASMRFTSVDDLVQFLTRELPWFSVERNQMYPDVLHLIDKRLDGREGYALERKVSIDFAGTLNDLAWALHGKIDNLHGFRGGLIHDVTTDYDTETVVVARDKTVRQILTDAVPLRCYGPILWRAKIATDGREVTAPVEVNFY